MKQACQTVVNVPIVESKFPDFSVSSDKLRKNKLKKIFVIMNNLLDAAYYSK